MTASLESLKLQQEGLRLGSRNAFLNVLQWDRRCHTVARSPLEVCDCAGRRAPGFYLGVLPWWVSKLFLRSQWLPWLLTPSCFWSVLRAGEPLSLGLSCLAWQSPLPHRSHYTPRGHNLNLCQNHTHHCPGLGGGEVSPCFSRFSPGGGPPFPPHPDHLQTSGVQTANCLIT